MNDCEKIVQLGSYRNSVRKYLRYLKREKKKTKKKQNARLLVQLVVFTSINGDSTFATLVKILLIDFIVEKGTILIKITNQYRLDVSKVIDVNKHFENIVVDVDKVVD